MTSSRRNILHDVSTKSMASFTGRFPATVQIVEEVYRPKPLEARDTLSKLANVLTDKNPKEDISLREVGKMLADISNTVTTVASHAFEQDRAMVKLQN